MLAVLAPGQGSQKPGFLTPWLTVSDAEATLRQWSALAGIDLLHLGTDADAEEIKDTAVTQPLLVSAALLAARDRRTRSSSRRVSVRQAPSGSRSLSQS